MSYCTQADLESRKSTKSIAELTGDADGETVDAAKVTRVIEDFAERMNNAIRVKYPALPFDSTNKFLNGLNVEGAYLLLEKDSYDGWTEENLSSWKLILADLNAIASGKIDLKTETADEEDDHVEGTFSTRPRIFGRNSLNGVEA